jgi:anti-sigma-K factor RskA
LDIKEYISSGILELYAAGALSPDEAKEVESMAAKYSEIKIELDAINDAYNNYASAYERNPNPRLRSVILDRIDEIEDSHDSDNSDDEKNNAAMMPDKGLIHDRNASSSIRMKYLMAAVVAFLIFNIAGNFFLYYKWKGTESQMTAFANENKRIKEEYELIKNNFEKKNEDLKMVMNRNNKIVDLKGMEISPASNATVYWDPNSKKVMLNVDNLPVPPAGKQYQLWALKDGKPIDAGIFDMDKDPMHLMPVTIPDADAFAVTLENKGGSAAPTLTQLYVMGKI